MFPSRAAGLTPMLMDEFTKEHWKALFRNQHYETTHEQQRQDQCEQKRKNHPAIGHVHLRLLVDGS
jgi:hypothetical protein